MPTVTPRALRTAIDAGSFDPVYVLSGDEDFIKDDLLRQIIAQAVDDATRDFNLDVRRGPELDAADLSSTLGQLPMMADRRVVVIREAHALKKAPMAVLEKYLAKPSHDLVLLLVLPAEETLPKQWPASLTVCECKPLSEDSVLKWVSHYLKENLQCGIAPDASALLVSHVGNDLSLLRGELEKLVSFTNGQDITAEAVEAVVGVRHGETLADLLDCVANRDARGALAILPRVMAQPKTTGVSIVMALTSQTFALAWGSAARANGTSIGQLSRGYFDVLREGGAFLGRPWGEAVQQLIKVLPQWDAARCDRALELLLMTDQALKDTRASSEEQIVESLVLGIVGTR